MRLKPFAVILLLGASLGIAAPAVASDRPMKEFTPQFNSPPAHGELKHPAPRDLVNPPAALQGTKTTQAVVLFGAVRWDPATAQCYKAGKLYVDSVGGYNYLTFQSDGNLVAYRQTYAGYWNHTRPRAAWNTRTMGADRICFQHDSNIVIYKGNHASWQSGKQLNMTGDRVREVAFGWPSLTGQEQLEYRFLGKVLKYWRLAK